MTAAIVCEAPAFRMRDVVTTGQIDPVCDAVEEILQLRHDVDDHALAVTLLRGIRPDMSEEAIARRIDYLLDLAGNVRDFSESGRLDSYSDAIDKYRTVLHLFAGGAR